MIMMAICNHTRGVQPVFRFGHIHEAVSTNFLFLSVVWKLIDALVIYHDNNSIKKLTKNLIGSLGQSLNDP